MITYGDLKTYAAEMTAEDETDTDITTTLLPRWVTRGLGRISSYRCWRFLQATYTLTFGSGGSPPNGSVLYLPHYIYRINSMFAENDLRNPVVMISPGEFDRLRPGSVSGWGRRDRLVMHGHYGVENDNPSAGVITVTASAAGSGSQGWAIEGLDANGYEIFETGTVAVGGSTPTTASFKAGIEGVRRFYLTGTATGTVVTASRGGTTVERLDSALEDGHEHYRVELFPIATGGSTYTARVWKRLRLTSLNDNTIIPLPAEFHYLLEDYLEAQIERWNGNHQAAAMGMQAFRLGLREMAAFENRNPNQRRNIGVQMTSLRR